MKKLIINADDFGLTKGCNKGIVQAFQEGIVTSTTIMINRPRADEAIKIAKENEIEDIGLHLTLTSGNPTLSIKEVQSLVDNNGMFYKRREALFSYMNFKEVEMELRSQIEVSFKKGLDLTHLDSHHHIHMYQGIREIVTKLAKEFNLPLRQPNKETKYYILKSGVKTTDYFSMDFYGEKASIENLKYIIEKTPDGILEIMTHPAQIDEELMELSSYNFQRGQELNILINKDIKQWIKERKIKLVSYRELGDYTEEIN